MSTDATMEPLLERVPERFATERLIVRCPRADDAAAVNAAVLESIDGLRPWMPWAQTAPSLERSEADCRRMQAKFLLREDLAMFVFERHDDGSEGDFIGGTGLHRIRWAARCFEVGYWCRTRRQGRGLMTEAVRGLIAVAFGALDARRLEIRMDARNERSRGVAERVGARLEGVLQREALDPLGVPRDTRLYALLPPDANAAR